MDTLTNIILSIIACAAVAIAMSMWFVMRIMLDIMRKSHTRNLLLQAIVNKRTY